MPSLSEIGKKLGLWGDKNQPLPQESEVPPSPEPTTTTSPEDERIVTIAITFEPFTAEEIYQQELAAEADAVEAEPTAPEYEHPPVDRFIVVTDDVESLAKATQYEVNRYLQSNPEVTHRCEVASSFSKLLELAFNGNAGQPAEVILLDHNYAQAPTQWPRDFRHLVSQYAEARGIDVSDMLENPDTLRIFKNATSVNYALVLRALGFEGKIFVISSAPPDAQLIKYVTDLWNNSLPNHQVEFPIQGYSMKAGRDTLAYSTSTIAHPFQEGTIIWEPEYTEAESDIKGLAATLPHLLGWVEFVFVVLFLVIHVTP